MQRKLLVVLCAFTVTATVFLVWRFHDEFPSYLATELFMTTTPRDEVDYSRLIDLTDFEFDTLPKICDDWSPFLLILVTTAAGNFERRKTVRETWGKNTHRTKTAFLLGSVRSNDSASDLEIEEKLVSENEEHGDLVRGNFVDSYRNLTYKHVMAMKYVKYHCPEAKYVLKADDDSFVNINALLEVVRDKFSVKGSENVMFCKQADPWPVVRDPNNPRYVSLEEYPEKKFPRYCWGFAIVYSPDVMIKLYATAQRSKYLWIEDVYSTGILAREYNVKRTSAFQNSFSSKQVGSITKSRKMNKKYLFGYNLSDEQVRELWKHV